MEVCDLHAGMDEKLTALLANQVTYMTRQIESCAAIQRIEGKVENGLTSTVQETATQVKTLHEKIAILEDFEWFREWITDMRNNIFKYLLKWAFIGGVLSIVYVMLMIYGQKFITRFIG